jgi:uncharacterized protein (TIGR02145 family)
LAENLRTSRYANGTPIVEFEAAANWDTIYQLTGYVTPAWCYYGQNAANESVYGKLYNGWTANVYDNVCPVGWHVPNDADWLLLADSLGGVSSAGGKMKSTSGWSSPNTGASNSSGFSAVPGGSRDENGNFINIGINGYWLSTTTTLGNTNHNGISLSKDNEILLIGDLGNGSRGYSIRCVKD